MAAMVKGVLLGDVSGGGELRPQFPEFVHDAFRCEYSAWIAEELGDLFFAITAPAEGNGRKK